MKIKIYYPTFVDVILFIIFAVMLLIIIGLAKVWPLFYILLPFFAFTMMLFLGYRSIRRANKKDIH